VSHTSSTPASPSCRLGSRPTGSTPMWPRPAPARQSCCCTAFRTHGSSGARSSARCPHTTG
jgi:hypothetical protein